MSNHKSYRCISIQPTYVRLLESIIMRRVNMEKILSSQYHEQAGFTKGKGIHNHINRLWSILKRVKEENLPIAIASIDIRGAYDGVDHEFLFARVR